MGGSKYSFESRTLRAASANYAAKTVTENFIQSKVRKIHDSMDPKGALLREARDSEANPSTVPIILALDLTGSMGSIPQHLVIEGLPKIMAGIMQRGVTDPTLLFMGVGDTECDSYPLQVGQFESGDLELDTWLTRTYLEGGGGGNAGESYLLAWYYASKHTVTDAWEKRKKKGFLFTCGDEPCLSSLPKNVIDGLMGQTVTQVGFTDKELLIAAQEKWEVYHLHILQGSRGESSLGYWKELLGDHCIAIKDYTHVSKIIADIVVNNSEKTGPVVDEHTSNPAKPSEEVYL